MIRFSTAGLIQKTSQMHCSNRNNCIVAKKLPIINV